MIGVLSKRKKLTHPFLNKTEQQEIEVSIGISCLTIAIV